MTRADVENLIKDNQEIFAIDNNGDVYHFLPKRFKFNNFTDEFFDVSEKKENPTTARFRYSQICTADDAEDYKRYKNIARVERLHYSKYDEIETLPIVFHPKKDPNFECVCFVKNRNIIIEQRYYGKKCKGIFKQPFNRENYRKALDKCVQLFMGEE